MKDDVSWLVSIDKGIQKLIALGGLMASILFVILMLLTVGDVTLRYLFNSPIPGSIEIATFIMVSAGTLGLGWCALKGMHIEVDIITSQFPKGVQAVLKGLNYALAILISLLIVSQTLSQSKFEKMLQVKGAITGIPQYPFYLVVAFGYFLLFLAVVILLIRTVTKEAEK